MKKLYFIQDLSCCSSEQVYSGHSGTGKNFKMYQGDYGKYAMKPLTKPECETLIKKVEKDAKGKFTFKWNIVPMTEINLCNFYSEEESNAYYELQNKQKLINA